METIVNLVVSGVKKLAELIPLWVRSSAEERAKIEEEARASNARLDGLFAAADTRDEAGTKAAQGAIDDARRRREDEPTKP